LLSRRQHHRRPQLERRAPLLECCLLAANPSRREGRSPCFAVAALNAPHGVEIHQRCHTLRSLRNSSTVGISALHSPARTFRLSSRRRRSISSVATKLSDSGTFSLIRHSVVRMGAVFLLEAGPFAFRFR